MTMSWNDALSCLWAFLSCAGFCIILNVRSGMLYCCAGGALGQLVYLLVKLTGAGGVFSCFLAAVAISAYSEIMARVRKCPVTGYLMISILPLVPGAGIYYTMEYALQGETAAFLQSGLHTLGIAGSLAVGVLVVSSIVRMGVTFRRNKRPRPSIK